MFTGGGPALAEVQELQFEMDDEGFPIEPAFSNEGLGTGIDLDSEKAEFSDEELQKLGLVENLDGAKEEKFEFSSLEEVVKSLGASEPWEKIASSSGGDVLKKSTKEWVYKEEGGQQETTIMRDGQILEDLWSKGFSVSESQKPNTDLFVREVYFADEKGNISYEVYNFKPEVVTVLPESSGLEFLGDDDYDVTIPVSKEALVDEPLVSEPLLIAQDTQETLNVATVAGEAQPEVSGISLEVNDGQEANLDLIDYDDGFDDTLIVEVKNVQDVLNAPDAPIYKLQPDFSEPQVATSLVEVENAVDVNFEKKAQDFVSTESIEGISIIDNLEGISFSVIDDESGADDIEAVMTDHRLETLPSQNDPIADSVIEQALISDGLEIKQEDSGIELVYARDAEAAFESFAVSDAVESLVYEREQKPELRPIKLPEVVGITLLDNVSFELTEVVEKEEKGEPSLGVIEFNKPDALLVPLESFIKLEPFESIEAGIEIQEQEIKPIKLTIPEAVVLQRDVLETIKEKPAELENEVAIIEQVIEKVLTVVPVPEINGITLAEEQDNKTEAGDNNLVIESSQIYSEPEIVAEAVVDLSKGIEIEDVTVTQIVENTKQASVAKAVKAKPVVIKQPTNKAVMRKNEAATKFVEITSEAKQEVRAEVKPKKAEVAKVLQVETTKAGSKENQQPVVVNAAVKSQAEPKIIQSQETIPGSTLEQVANPTKPDVDRISSIRASLQTILQQQPLKPIVAQRARIPAELINKNLTFKPSVVSGDDGQVTNITETYVPQFELAA